MQEKPTCPGCSKPSYTSSPQSCSPCPHCDIIFNKSMSMGPETRLEHRFNWSAYCKVFADDISGRNPLIVAKTMDVSPHGAKIRYTGRPLNIGSRVDIHIIDLGIRQDADVIWANSKKETDISSGLRFYEPVALRFLSSEGRIIPLSLSAYIPL